ncbi:hypothetical protein [Natronosalvus rutilus]|uniref:hypothetical protein n=1 Tax=Natronosalvus rutilus TaxID=2953753 RepID=UPI002880A2A9|nr:hypothetical protein [Natronosalvus rutilus]
MDGLSRTRPSSGFGFATPVSDAVDDAAAAERTLASDGSADLTGARTDARTPDPIDARTELEAALESPVELVSAKRGDCEDGPARPDDVLASLAPWAPVGAVLDGGSSWDSDTARDSDHDPDPGRGTGASPEPANRSRVTHSSRIPYPYRAIHLPRDPLER